MTTEQELPRLKELYQGAFPRSERKPFRVILEKWKEGRMEVLSILEDGEFCGLAISLLCGDRVLLDYFAMEEEARGQGLGGRALEAIQERYRGKRLVLEIEEVHQDARNYEQRVRRKSFYLRNGMVDAGLLVRAAGVEMELLTYGGPVSYEEYEDIYRTVMGDRVTRMIGLRLLEDRRGEPGISQNK